MFAADSNFQIRFDAAAPLSTEAHQLTNAFGVEHLERVVRKNFAIDVSRKEAS